MLVLHLLGNDDRALAIPRPGALGPTYAIWDHRHPLTRGLVALAHQERNDAHQYLVEATSRVQASPIPLINRDVLIGWAAYHHSTRPRHAATLLASFRGHVRTPAAFATYLHYRDVTRRNLPRQEQKAILEHAATLDPSQLLDQEATRAPGTA